MKMIYNKNKELNLELKNMHLVYLDSTYIYWVLNRWKQINYTGSGIWQGRSLYEYIGGPPWLSPDSKKCSNKHTWRGKAEFTIEIENTGFGKLFQDAELFLMIENEDQHMKEFSFYGSGKYCQELFSVENSDRACHGKFSQYF